MVHLKTDDMLPGDKNLTLATHVKLEEDSSKEDVKIKVGHVSKSWLSSSFHTPIH